MVTSLSATFAMNAPENNNKNIKANLQSLAEKLVYQAMDIEIKCCSKDFDVNDAQNLLREIETTIKNLKEEIHTITQ